MKRKLLLLAVMGMLACSYANAQIKKGSVLLGGSVGFGRSQTEVKTIYAESSYKSDSRYFYALPALGIAIHDNLVLGGDLRYENGKQSYTSTTSQKGKTTSYGAGAFIRKYWKVADKLYLFGNGGLGYRYLDNYRPYENPANSIQEKSHNINLSFYPGVSFAITRRVHLESSLPDMFNIGYTSATERNKATGQKISSRNSFGIGSSLSNTSSFAVGVKFILSK